jgi:rare lipoprotein A
MAAAWLLATGFASAQEPDTAAAPELPAPTLTAPEQQVLGAPPQAAEIARGRASWYGPRFHGRRTSSGERFNMNELTAAHGSLQFGTRVLVRNVANGREVVVRINDRGPHIRSRIIDLSQAAAKALGFLHLGEAPVVLMKILTQPACDSNPAAAPTASCPRD